MYRYTHFRVASCVCWSGSVFHRLCIRGVRPHDFAGGFMMGVIPTMEPTVKVTGSIRGHIRGLKGNRHTEICGWLVGTGVGC